MLDPLSVTANERETVRVFSIGPDVANAKSWVAVQSNVEAAIGSTLDMAHCEHFAASDLADLGLSQFLIDGYGISQSDIGPDHARLDTAGPYILLLRARAFSGLAVTLTPKPPLVHLGTYGQIQPDPSAPMNPVVTEAVEGASGKSTVAKTERKGSLMPLLIFLALAAILFAILLIPKL